MTVIDSRRAELPPEFAEYVETVKGIQRQYRRKAHQSEWFSNTISVALITAGSAVGLTGVVGELSVQLGALLGFTVVVLEGASRVFRPACRAVHARQATHALEHELRLFVVGARPYTGGRRDAQLRFVEHVEKILLKAYTQEDSGGQDSSTPAPAPMAATDDDKRTSYAPPAAA
jgi:Protein of unknown function (DUF4231)